MNNTINRAITRIALPVVSAGLIGGAALGMAGMANAATQIEPHGPNFHAPSMTAQPAPEAIPGTHQSHRAAHLENLRPGYQP
jgi:hypothetical protein